MRKMILWQLSVATDRVENQRKDQQTSQINASFVVMTVTQTKNALHKTIYVISVKEKAILPKHVVK